MPVSDDKETEGLAEMRRLQDEHLKSYGPRELTKDQIFLRDVTEDVMLQYLRGRKYRPEYAWETLKRYAEVKFITYPEMFLEVLPPELANLKNCPVVSILKSRDSLGRRLLFFDSNRWDVNQHSMVDLCKFGNSIMDKLLKDEDCMKNGLIMIQDCSNIGIKHCAQYSIKIVKQLVAVYWHAYPIKYKGFYFVNTPTMLYIALRLAKFCFPKKLAERLAILSGESSYDALHQIIPKDKLPKVLNGTLEYEDAVDQDLSVTLTCS